MAPFRVCLWGIMWSHGGLLVAGYMVPFRFCLWGGYGSYPGAAYWGGTWYYLAFAYWIVQGRLTHLFSFGIQF